MLHLTEIKRLAQKNPNICNFFKIQLFPAAYKGKEELVSSPKCP